MIGGFLYILVFVFIALKFIKVFILKYFSTKKINLSDYEICIYTAIFINFFPFFPSGNFFNNWLSIIYFIPFGFVLYERSK